MTREELRVWMTAHGYSVRRLAKALGKIDPSTVQRWRDGTSKVPPWLDAALRGLEKGGE